jgi:hypothetical protein
MAKADSPVQQMLQFCHNNFGRLRIDFACFFEISILRRRQARYPGPSPGHDWIREILKDLRPLSGEARASQRQRSSP